jgi:hypothetical protein
MHRLFQFFSYNRFHVVDESCYIYFQYMGVLGWQGWKGHLGPCSVYILLHEIILSCWRHYCFSLRREGLDLLKFEFNITSFVDITLFSSWVVFNYLDFISSLKHWDSSVRRFLKSIAWSMNATHDKLSNVMEFPTSLVCVFHASVDFHKGPIKTHN